MQVVTVSMKRICYRVRIDTHGKDNSDCRMSSTGCVKLRSHWKKVGLKVLFVESGRKSIERVVTEMVADCKVVINEN